MSQLFKQCVLQNLWFKILSLSAVILLFVSLILPPKGVIDPSVVAGTGEIMGFAAIWTVLVAIEKNKGITVHHGETTITIDGKTYKLEDQSMTNGKPME